MWVGQLICTNHLVIKMKSKLYKQYGKGGYEGGGGEGEVEIGKSNKQKGRGEGLLQLLTYKIPSRGVVAVA